mmetsp:Transcript_78082/g.216640  ORF Transcript_78082/g.216640 Transcript_78082/m.216640 type:complete len:236 (+) Transcript_78082:3393-4100(+)
MRLAAGDEPLHFVIDDGLEFRVVLGQDDGQGLDGQQLADHLEAVRIGAGGDDAIELHIVQHEAIDLAGGQHVHGLGVVRRLDDLDVQGTLAVGLGDGLQRRGALGGHQRAALELRQIGDAAVRTHQIARAGDVVRHRERHLLAALGVVGRRAAFEIGLAVDHRLDAVGRRDQHELRVQARHLQALAHRLGHLQAQVHRIADRPAVRQQVAEGHGRLAVGDHDATAGLDAVQHRAR